MYSIPLDAPLQPALLAFARYVNVFLDDCHFRIRAQPIGWVQFGWVQYVLGVILGTRSEDSPRHLGSMDSRRTVGEVSCASVLIMGTSGY